MTQLQQRELMKRMAWVNIQNEIHPPERPQDANDRKALTKAMYMLAYLGAIDMAIYDLIDEMEAIGKYRHANKRNINRARDIILNAHNTSYKRLYNYDFGGCKQYNDAMEVYYKAINDCVALEAPERAYNIVMAICRLQAKKRGKVTIRTYAPSFEVDKIPQMLEGLGIKDYHLDNIIEQRINKIKHTK